MTSDTPGRHRAATRDEGLDAVTALLIALGLALMLVGLIPPRRTGSQR